MGKDVVTRRVRTDTHGRSMEAEPRAIVTDAIESDQTREPNLAESIRRRFAPFGGVEPELHPPVPASPRSILADFGGDLTLIDPWMVA